VDPEGKRKLAKVDPEGKRKCWVDPEGKRKMLDGSGR
jgi:hypothetical protein